jgi:hypothetical protein
MLPFSYPVSRIRPAFVALVGVLALVGALFVPTGVAWAAPGEGSISGITTSGGHPLGGVNVYIYPVGDPNPVLLDVRTDINGEYSVPSIADGDYHVQFAPTAPEYPAEWWDNTDAAGRAVVSIVDGAAISGINADFEYVPYYGVLTGSVTSGGAPVAGAHISVESLSGPEASTMTDVDGSWSVADLHAGDYFVRIEGPDSLTIPEWWDNATTREAAFPVTVVAGTTVGGLATDLTPRTTGEIRGRLTGAGPNGTAISSAVVSIWRDGIQLSNIPVGQSGFWSAENLQPGSYQLLFSAGGNWQHEYWQDAPTLEDATSITLSVGDSIWAPAELTMIDATPGTISGTLAGRDGAGNVTPIAGTVYISAVDTVGGYAYSVATEADGSFSFPNLQPDRYVFQFSADGWVTEWWSDRLTQATANWVDLQPGQTISLDPELSTPSALGSVSGSVLSDGPYVTRLQGVPVDLVTLDGTILASTTTDADGTWTFSAPAGDYHVHFLTTGNVAGEWYLDGASAAVAQTVTITAGHATAGLEASLGRVSSTPGTISGTLRDEADGSPTPGYIGVYAPSASGYHWVGQVDTDASGAFTTMDLLPGEYILNAQSQDYGQDEYWQNSTSIATATRITLAPGQHISGIDPMVDVPDPYGLIVRLFTFANGLAVPFQGYLTLELVDSGYTASTATDANGEIELGDVLTGLDIVVRGSADDPEDPMDDASPWQPEWYLNSPTRTGATQVTVTGDLQYLDIVLDPVATASIAGRVTSDEYPDGLEGRTVQVNDGGYFRDAITDSDGYYLIDQLPAGDYTTVLIGDNVHQPIWYPGVTDGTRQEKVQVADGEAIAGIDFHQRTPGAVSGTVTLANGAPAVGIDVHAFTATGGPGPFATTDGAGHYSIPGLEPGSRLVVFSLSDYDAYTTQWYLASSTRATATAVEVVAGGVTSDVNATLVPETVITGRVMAGGMPLSYATVKTFTAAGVEVSHIEADAGGQYAVRDLPPGSYYLQFSSPHVGNWASEWWSDRPTRAGSTAVTLAVGQTRSGLDVILAPGASISGTVDFDGPSLPLGSTRVQAIDSAGAVAAETYVSSSWSNTFSLRGLPAGDYRLRFLGEATVFATEWWDDSVDEPGSQVISLLAGQQQTGVDATLEVGLTISGTITSATPNAYLSGISVTAVRDDGVRVAGYVWPDGTYEIRGLRPGDYLVEYRSYESASEWWEDQPTADTATPITLTDADLSGVDVHLEIGAAVAGAVLASGSNPTALEDAVVELYTSTGELVRTAASDVYGLFLLRGLPAGDYTIVASAPGRAATSSSFSLVAGHETRIPDIVLSTGPALTAAPTPTVSGSRVLGQVLTANAGLWKPAPVSLHYQWNRGGFPIAGANASTYLLGPADIGYTVTVTVTGAKPGYATQSKTSSAGSIVSGGVLTQTPQPTLSGVAAVGQVLTADAGTWGPGGVSLSYRWYRDGVVISGATASTRTLVTADAGTEITVAVTGSQPGATSVVQTSEPLLIEQRLTTTPKPVITGTGAVGQTLTANSAAWAPDPVELEYQWNRNGSAIPGATDPTYEVQVPDAGQAITVTVTGHKAGYTSVAKTSNAKQVQQLITQTQQPIIIGIAAVGQTLSADAGEWGPGIVALTYKWYRNGLYVSSGASRVLAPADAGSFITVVATGTQTGFTSVAVESEATEIEQRFTTTGTPTISGTLRVGSTLTAAANTWSPAPDFAYQWNRGGTPITGAVDPSYELVIEDAGAAITVTVTGSRSGFTSVSKTSAAKTIELLLTASTTPEVTGAPTVGAVLTAVPGAWSPQPITLKYQWKRGGVNVGTNSATYTVVAADAGAQLTVTVTSSKAGYTPVVLTSEPFAIESALTIATPTITGVLEVGSVLTASPGSWGPAPVDLSFQWNRAGVAIPGADESTYELQPTDAGASVTVTVTGQKDGYTSKSRTSAGKTIKLVFASTPAPVITGTPSVGTTLTVTTTPWDPTTGTPTFRWYRDGVLVKTGATYKVVALDVGTELTVTMTGTRTGYSSHTETSAGVQPF